jgi:hypothetical protein
MSILIKVNAHTLVFPVFNASSIQRFTHSEMYVHISFVITPVQDYIDLQHTILRHKKTKFKYFKEELYIEKEKEVDITYAISQGSNPRSGTSKKGSDEAI